MQHNLIHWKFNGATRLTQSFYPSPLQSRDAAQTKHEKSFPPLWVLEELKIHLVFTTTLKALLSTAAIFMAATLFNLLSIQRGGQ